MEKIFEAKTCRAEYNREKERIEYSFNGYPDINESKSMYMMAMDFLKKNRTTSFVSDLRELKGTFSMLNDWIIEFLRPAVQLGLRKSAMVLNEDIFTQFSANDVIKKVKLIEVQVFRDIEEARQWTEL